MCINEQEVRPSLSQAKGQIYNHFGDEWQNLIDHLHKIAKLHGLVNKIELVQSYVGNQWLDFIIYYDDLEAGKKFVHYMEVLNNLLQPVNYFNNLQYTPPPAALQASAQPN